MPDHESHKVDTQERIYQRLGTIAAIVGSLSVICAFIALYASWVFARGIVKVIGFPINILSFKGSLDIFASLAIEYTFTFILAIAVGFFPVNYNAKRLLHIILPVGITLSFVVVSIISTFEVEISTFRIILFSVNLLGPIFVGYVIQASPSLQLKFLCGVLISAMVFNIFTVQLYYFGKDTGHKLLSPSTENLYEGGVSATKLSEFPMVYIYSKEKLILQTSSTSVEGVYLYTPQKPNFIRLIFTDADKYYFVEVIANHSELTP